jgi:hypothetical protein
MLRDWFAVIAVGLSFSLISAASAAPAQKPQTSRTHRISRHWHGYGFLPGYRPPELIARDRAAHDWDVNGPLYQFYGPAWPGFYEHRWNGGRFGPCYTETPIGPIWNCGR